MLGLTASLIGVVLAVFGIFLFFSNRWIGNRRLSLELSAVSLFVGGGAILLSSVTLQNTPQEKNSSTPFDPERMLEEQPTAAGNSSPGAVIARPSAHDQLHHRTIAVLAWGTPSDMDNATEAEISAYAGKLQQMGHDLVMTYARESAITSPPMTRQEFHSLENSAQALAGWCQRLDSELILALGVGTQRLSHGDYALWREPLYQLLECRTGRVLRRSGRVMERPGDRFPYHLAIHNDVTLLLQEWAGEK